MTTKKTSKPRKTGSAKRHEVNRGELDPLKTRVRLLELVTKHHLKRILALERKGK